MIAHKAKCQNAYITSEEAQSNDVHSGNECILVLEKYVCTESVRKQMVESFLSHIYQYW